MYVLQILKVTKGHIYVYSNLNLRSYGQLFVLVLNINNFKLISQHKKIHILVYRTKLKVKN